MPNYRGVDNVARRRTALSTLECKALEGGVEFEVLAAPGSARSCIRGVHGGALKVAVRAAPEKGKANAEVAEVLAAWLGVPRKQVAIVRGETSRRKRVRVAGLSKPALQARAADPG